MARTARGQRPAPPTSAPSAKARKVVTNTRRRMGGKAFAAATIRRQTKGGGD